MEWREDSASLKENKAVLKFFLEGLHAKKIIKGNKTGVKYKIKSENRDGGAKKIK